MTEPIWLDEVEMRAWLGFVRTRDLIAAAVGRDSSRESNLTYVEYSVLASLSKSPDHRLTFADLAERLEWSQSRLSHQITRMEKRGLVIREPIPDDARRTAARLTPHGADLLGSAAPAHARSVRRHMINALDRDQLAALADIYDTLLAHHRSGTPAGGGGVAE
ncbi:MarR family winged helix-turn-helix transcriptional regulator [Nocardia goodfellowii]|uniref:DNA-binding MarR family transcriptional regulator n=1 Tax=Nocardia goodfellowii TaxID=882446 RepID=A0ABS4QGU4_9NOCA|nr:MarR family winged helix-turn-helix transcriptional regulator [Nocardia goodfellowii]MBP2190927.1 DNA-binding MarR family transcriptional regulator [Nocardia goodfellowii]